MIVTDTQAKSGDQPLNMFKHSLMWSGRHSGLQSSDQKCCLPVTIIKMSCKHKLLFLVYLLIMLIFHYRCVIRNFMSLKGVRKLVLTKQVFFGQK